MKHYEYEVLYMNGKTEFFYCNGFNEAIILASAFAIQSAWDMKIQHIIDEKGKKITNIQLPTFTEA